MNRSHWSPFVLLIFLVLGSRTAHAETLPTTHPELELRFYGEALARQADWYRNFQDTTPRKRSRVQLGRFVIEPELLWRQPGGEVWSTFEAEIEFENGGTGTTLEYDRLEESGEFETEVEAGGEVILEKLEMSWPIGSDSQLRVGLTTVPVGWISQRSRPSQYFGPEQDLGEARLLPVTWRDPGLSISGQVSSFRWIAGVFTGLNSELFRKSHFIKFGQGRQFEELSADELAIAARIDWAPLDAPIVVGISAYWGGSRATRNKVEKLSDPADVAIWTVHGLGEWPMAELAFTPRRARIRGQWLNASLANARSVTQANSTLSGPLAPGQQLALGSRAEARLLELGFELRPSFWIAARYDAVDSMAQTEAGIDRDPRVREASWALGTSFGLMNGTLLKFEWRRVENGLPSLPIDHQLGLGLAWDYDVL